MKMEVEISCSTLLHLPADTLLIGLFADDVNAAQEFLAADNILKEQLQKITKRFPACSKYTEITVLPVFHHASLQQIILLGLGKKAELTADKIRQAMGTAARFAVKKQSVVLATIINQQCFSYFSDQQQAVQTLVEGAFLGAYRFDCYKTEQEDKTGKLEKLILVSESADTAELAKLQQAAQKGQAVANGVNLTRDLVNHPAGYMTPSKMADNAKQIAAENIDTMELTVLDKEELIVKNFHAFLAVAQGSCQPAKLIVLKYTGTAPEVPYTAFVGKGITFDSGGISLKPSENMGDMKGDMAGAAAVLGAMQAIGQLKPKCNILAVLPCTENMPSGSAYRPGDVISSLAGKTIEIISTDAEGRLILADAVAYAKQLGAQGIVDLATLTGACVTALGTLVSGVISNNSELQAAVLAAAAASGERMWEMPAYPEYKEQFKSNIADLKNTGGRPGGMITAGLFIGEFVGDTPWVHIDIAGTSDTDKEQGYNIKGGTGAGVRTLIQFACQKGKN